MCAKFIIVEFLQRNCYRLSPFETSYTLHPDCLKNERNNVVFTYWKLCTSSVYLVICDVHILFIDWLLLSDLIQNESICCRKWFGLELFIGCVNNSLELISGEGCQLQVELFVVQLLFLLSLQFWFLAFWFVEIPRDVLREAHVFLLTSEVDDLLSRFDWLALAQFGHAVATRRVVVVESDLEVRHCVALWTAHALLARENVITVVVLETPLVNR